MVECYRNLIVEWLIRYLLDAVQLYEENGTKVEGFAGVPVYQAQGLIVRTAPDTSYVPLFLGKADLDQSLAAMEGQRCGLPTAQNNPRLVEQQYI